jgi:hypothetical protein
MKVASAIGRAELVKRRDFCGNTCQTFRIFGIELWRSNRSSQAAVRFPALAKIWVPLRQVDVLWQGANLCGTNLANFLPRLSVKTCVNLRQVLFSTLKAKQLTTLYYLAFHGAVRED